MNKSTVTGIVIGVVIATGGAVIANYTLRDDQELPWQTEEPAYAEVLSVKPVKEAVKTPREVCEQVAVTEKAPVKDEHQIAGTVAGAVLGGVLGNQVGGGTGKKVATVAGAAAGGYAGKKVQENMQDKNTSTRYENRCRTVYDSHDEIKGYDVAYQLGDSQGTVRMAHDPGSRIPVENGVLVTE